MQPPRWQRLFAGLALWSAGACASVGGENTSGDAAAPPDGATPVAETDAAHADGGPDGGADGEAADDASAGDRSTPAPDMDAGAPARDAAATDDAVRHYGLDWLDGVDGGFVTHASIDVDASVERVWALVRDVNGYGRWCSVLSADAGSVAPGQPIHLSIQLLDPPFGPTDSDEQIEVVDDTRHAIAWGRDFGFEQKTLRFQLVTPIPGGARYTTALRYPAELGSLVIPLLGPNLDRAFRTIAEDLARAAR